MPDLTFQIAETPGQLIMKVIGEASVKACADLERQMTILMAKRPKKAILDLSGLTFIGSLGMGCLVSARRGIKPWGGEMVLAALQPAVLEAFKHASLHKAFNIYNSVEDAQSGGPIIS